MRVRRWELVATDESTVVTEPVLDPIVVEDLECDRSFPNPTCTEESDGFEIFCKTNDGLNYVITSETGPGWRRRQFTEMNPVQM